MVPIQIKQAIYELIEHQEIELVAVFGSRARADHQSRSDVDLAIKFKQPNPLLLLQISEQIAQSSLLELDIIDFDAVDPEMQAHILRDGKLLCLNNKWFINISRLGDALQSLEAALALELDAGHIVRDSAIQRFEYSIELFGKTLKHLLEERGKIVNLPRDVLEAAYKESWIDNPDDWLLMLKDRNETSHTYKERVAVEIYKHIRANFPIMRSTYEKLYQKFIGDVNLKNFLTRGK